VAAGEDGSSHEQQVFLEAVQLRLEWRDARRAHAGVARDRRDREGSADCRGPGKQENLPGRQLAVSTESDDLLTLSAPMPVS